MVLVGFSAAIVNPRFAGSLGGNVAVATEDRIVPLVNVLSVEGSVEGKVVGNPHNLLELFTDLDLWKCVGRVTP
jgi:hypothetical protein